MPNRKTTEEAIETIDNMPYNDPCSIASYIGTLLGKGKITAAQATALGEHYKLPGPSKRIGVRFNPAEIELEESPLKMVAVSYDRINPNKE